MSETASFLQHSIRFHNAFTLHDRTMENRPQADRFMRISAISIDSLGDVEPETVEAIRSIVNDRIGLPTLIGATHALPVESFSFDRGQYRSTDLLFYLDMSLEDEALHLALTTADLYAPPYGFVFGETSPTGRSAIVSMARFEADKTDHARDTRLRIWRTGSEAIARVGEMLGLPPCKRPDCVMWTANTVAEIDRKGSQFCTEHRRQLDRIFKKPIPLERRP